MARNNERQSNKLNVGHIRELNLNDLNERSSLMDVRQLFFFGSAPPITESDWRKYRDAENILDARSGPRRTSTFEERKQRVLATRNMRRRNEEPKQKK